MTAGFPNDIVGSVLGLCLNCLQKIFFETIFCETIFFWTIFHQTLFHSVIS